MDEQHFDIYEDLDEFALEEKLKEKTDEIVRLTEKLNKSVATITELEKKIQFLKTENKELLKNTSSLLLTAKVEVSRKKREITLLQEQRDNRIFRRPNSLSIAVQTDNTMNPFQSHIENKIEKKTNELVIDTQKADKCDQSLVAPDESSAPGNVRENLNNYHIPKKNPFARLVDINSDTKVSSLVRSDEKSKDNQLENVKDQQQMVNCLKKYHIPKKNPSARRLDIVEPVSIVTQDNDTRQPDHERNKNLEFSEVERRKPLNRNNTKSNSYNRNEGAKERPANAKDNSRKDDNTNKRKYSPDRYSSDRKRGRDSHAKSDKFNDYSMTRRSTKRSHEGKDRNDEVFRPRSKSSHYRSRSRSTSPRPRSKSHRSKTSRSDSSRSRSKSSRREERHTKDEKTEESNLKTKKVEKSPNESLTKVDENELEAMLLAKTKILQEIDSEKNPDSERNQLNHEENISQQPKRKIVLSVYQKRKSSTANDNDSDKFAESTTLNAVSDNLEKEKSANGDFSGKKEDKDSTTKSKEASTDSISKSNENIVTAAALDSKSDADQTNKKECNSETSIEGTKLNLPPTVTSNDNNTLNEKMLVAEVALMEDRNDDIAMSVSDTPEIIANSENVNNSIQFENMENSNSGMDIDYELTERTNNVEVNATLASSEVDTTQNMSCEDDVNPTQRVSCEAAVNQSKRTCSTGEVNTIKNEEEINAIQSPSSKDKTDKVKRGSSKDECNSTDRVSSEAEIEATQRMSPENEINDTQSTALEDEANKKKRVSYKDVVNTIESMSSKYETHTTKCVSFEVETNATQQMPSEDKSNITPETAVDVTQHIVSKEKVNTGEPVSSAVDVNATERVSIEDKLNENQHAPPVVEVNATNEGKTIPSATNAAQNESSAKNRQSSIDFNSKSPLAEKVDQNDIPAKDETNCQDSSMDVSMNSSLNGSFKKYVLSKSTEYTVQDVGHEIHIYLTKRRKKNRKVKVVS